MCQPKSEGGRRCHTHLKQQATRLQATITKHQAAGKDTQQREAKLANIQTLITQREQETAERDRNLQQQQARLRAEKEARAARKAARAEARRTGQPVTYGTSGSDDIAPPAKVQFAINDDLVTRLKAQAKEEGTDFSKLVRRLLTEPINFETKPAQQVPSLTGESPRGRGRTEEDKKRDKIKSVRMPSSVREKLDELAHDLSLTTSDLVRTILEGRDPRHNGGHMSSPGGRTREDNATTVRRRSHFARLEAPIGEDGEAIANYYRDLYKDALPATISPS